jgi:hypothetical protein
VIEVVAFAGALADAGEHRVDRVLLRDVVDQLEHVHGLADAGAAEQADLAALGERADQVDDLDAGLEQFGRGGARRTSAPRWIAQWCSDSTGPTSSIGSPSTSMMRPSVALPTGTEIGAPVLEAFEAALQAVRRAERDATDDAVAQLLLDFERQERSCRCSSLFLYPEFLGYSFKKCLLRPLRRRRQFPPVPW